MIFSYLPWNFEELFFTLLCSCMHSMLASSFLKFVQEKSMCFTNLQEINDLSLQFNDFYLQFSLISMKENSMEKKLK